MDFLRLQELLAKHLEKEVRNLQSTLSNKNSTPQNIEAALKSFESSWKILQDLKKEAPRRWTWPLILAASCLVVIGLLATIHKKPFFIDLDVQTEAAATTLANDWRLEEGIRMERFSAASLDRLEGAGLNLYLQSPRRGAWFETENKSMRLESLDVSQINSSEIKAYKAPCQMEWLRDTNRDVQVFLSHCAVFGRLRLNHQIEMSAGKEASSSVVSLNRTVDFPEAISFWGDARGEVPVRLRLYSSQPWTAYGLSLQRLHFDREFYREAGATQYLSAVLGGEIFLATVQAKQQIRLRDRLSLEIATTERLTVQDDQELIRIRFAGMVQSALLGPRGFERELAPTWLEYIYHQEPWSIFWGAVVFLWSLLWGAKNILLK